LSNTFEEGFDVKAIRVTYEYIPDLESRIEGYCELGIKTVEDAMAYDKAGVQNGDAHLSNFADPKWEVVDIDG
jgi:hypothetical protein